jgi:hypothetical protein
MPASQPGECHGGLTVTLLRWRLGAADKDPGTGPLAPLPQKQRAGPGPEDLWPAKLGSAGRLVKATLWTAVCGSWGSRGVSLWIAVRTAVDSADR